MFPDEEADLQLKAMKAWTLQNESQNQLQIVGFQKLLSSLEVPT